MGRRGDDLYTHHQSDFAVFCYVPYWHFSSDLTAFSPYCHTVSMPPRINTPAVRAAERKRRAKSAKRSATYRARKRAMERVKRSDTHQIGRVLDVRQRLSVIQYRVLFVPRVKIVKDENGENMQLWIDPDLDLETSEMCSFMRTVMANRVVQDRVLLLRRVQAAMDESATAVE